MSLDMNLLTVDLEEWFVVEIFSGRYRFEDWPSLPSTLIKNTRALLKLFRSRDVKATFFIVGWCAERFPGLVREIIDQGHEIGCHSYRHLRVDKMDRDAFFRETERATKILTEASGVRPRGFRAPSWSMNASIPWAFEVLADLGYEYDSSIFPIKHDIYGMPDGPRHMFKMRFDSGKSLWELPSSTYRLLGRNIPVSGGGYLRHSPYWYSRAMIRRLNRLGQPVMIYMHPWEMDDNPPRIDHISRLQRFRTYGSTRLFRHKLERLLSDFEFTNIANYIRLNTRQKIGFERE